MAYYKGGNGDLKTSTKTVVPNTSYPIVVGKGGSKNKDGGNSSAFGVTATGGKGATDSSAGANSGNGKGGLGGTSSSGQDGYVKIVYKRQVLGYFEPRVKGV